MQSIHWTEQEYDQLAQALRKEYPERASAQASSPKQCVFTTNEVDTVMRATLRRERQQVLTPWMTRKLAIKIGGTNNGSIIPRTPRKRTPPANGHIRWEPPEWKYYALSLVTMFPQFDLVNSPDLAELRLNHLNKAAAMMAPGRQRTFKALGGPIKYLLKVFETARQKGDALFMQTSSAQPQNEPAETLAPVVPVKIHAIKQTSTSCKVFWKKGEWIAIATELHRQFPHAKYPERNHLGGLTPADVAGAQYVLSEDRRRKNLHMVSMGQLRTPLLEAFKAVRHMQVEEAQERMAKAQQDHKDMLERAAVGAVVPNQWEVLFKPLVEMLVREVSAQLLPSLLEGLREAGHVAIPRPTPPAQLSLAPAPVPTEARKASLRIAIVCNEQKNSYKEDMDREFPNVDFVYLHQNNLTAISSCDKAMVLIKFVGHPTTKKMRKLFGDRYVPVNGGASEMKRLVSGWLYDAAKDVGVCAA